MTNAAALQPAFQAMVTAIQHEQERAGDIRPFLTVAQLTGTLRGLERDRFVAENRVFARFLVDSTGVEAAPGTVCLVCTSAGEVGVNMSGDHLVCDLTPFDSMAQRFGRVNRLGYGDAQVEVIATSLPNVGDQADESVTESDYDTARARTAELLATLPVLGAAPQGGSLYDASPAALDMLPLEARRRAFSPRPVTLPVSDALFDAWALTTVRETLRVMNAGLIEESSSGPGRNVAAKPLRPRPPCPLTQRKISHWCCSERW